MRRSLRLAVAAGAALAAFAFTGSAWAIYKPALTVTSLNNKPGKPTTLLLGHAQVQADDATAKDTIYTPLGYQVNLTQAVGTKVGIVLGAVVLRGGGNTEAPIEGDVVVDSPANYPPASNQCTPGQTHEAVWRLDVMVAGSPLRVPIYVDHVTAGPEALFASAKIQLCLLGPVSTPLGAQLLVAVFSVQGVFTNPANTSPRYWHGLFTPYLPNSGTPNPAGTIEGQAVSAGKTSMSLTVRRLKRGFVLIQGRVTADGMPISGVDVDVKVGGKTFTTKTKSKGIFTLRKRLKKKTRIRAETVAVKALPSCPAPPIGAPQGCQTASLSFVATSNTVTARPRR